MPRSTKNSDDETELRTGRKTRTVTGPSVIDSPLRRSTRIRQPTNKQNESSPDSPMNDNGTVQVVRHTRRRTGSMDSQAQPRWKSVKNAITSDITDQLPETNITDTPTKKNTRRSLADIPSLDVTRAATRTKRNTRAGSEAKTSPPVRTTRKTRASSVGPESIQELKAKERSQLEQVETPVRTRRRASIVPSRSPVLEETEQKQSIPCVELETILPKVEETCALEISDCSVNTMDRQEQTETTSSKLSDESNEFNNTLTKSEEYRALRELASDTQINTTLPTSNNGDQMINDAKLSPISEKELDRSSVESDSCVSQIETVVHDTPKKFIRDGTQEISKMTESNTGNESFNMSIIGEEDKSPGNKENQCTNIIVAVSYQQNKEIATVNTTALSPKPFNSGLINKETKDKAIANVGDTPSESGEEVRKKRSINVIKEIVQFEESKKCHNMSNNSDMGKMTDAIFVHDSEEVRCIRNEGSENLIVNKVPSPLDVIGDIEKNESMPPLNESITLKVDKNETDATECIETRNKTDDINIDGANVETSERPDKSALPVTPLNDAGTISVTCTVEEETAKIEADPAGVINETKDCNEKVEQGVSDQLIIVSDNEKVEDVNNIEAVNVSHSDTEINVSTELTGSDSMTLKMSDSNTTDVSNQPSDKADEKRSVADMDDQCSVASESRNMSIDEYVGLADELARGPAATTTLARVTPIAPKPFISIDCDGKNVSTIIDDTATLESDNEANIKPSKEPSPKRQSADEIEESVAVGKDTSEGKLVTLPKSEGSLSDDGKSDSDTNICNLFQDIPASEWENKDSVKRQGGSEMSSVHSVSTERLENESEAECDFILVDMEAWLAAEKLKAVREKENFDYDSDDTVVLKSQLDSLLAQDEGQNLHVVSDDEQTDLDTNAAETPNDERDVQMKSNGGSIETKCHKEKIMKVTRLVSARILNRTGPALSSKRNLSSDLSNATDRRLSAPAKVSSSQCQRPTGVGKGSTEELNDNLRLDKGNASPSGATSDMPRSCLKGTCIKKSDKTPPQSNLEIGDSEAQGVEAKNLKVYSSRDASRRENDNCNDPLNISVGKKKRPIEMKIGNKTKTSRPCSADGDANENDSNESDAEERDSTANGSDAVRGRRVKLSRNVRGKRNYSTMARVDSNSGGEECSNVETDSSTDVNESVKIPRFLYAGTTSDDDGDDVDADVDADADADADADVNVNINIDRDSESPSSKKSIDSDIAREYNLHGKNISKYSDDDVPGDECRASETESSDSQDNGSDLADFVVDDDETEEEGDCEQAEEREANREDEEDDEVEVEVEMKQDNVRNSDDDNNENNDINDDDDDDDDNNDNNDNNNDNNDNGENDIGNVERQKKAERGNRVTTRDSLNSTSDTESNESRGGRSENGKRIHKFRRCVRNVTVSQRESKDGNGIGFMSDSMCYRNRNDIDNSKMDGQKKKKKNALPSAKEMNKNKSKQLDESEIIFIRNVKKLSSSIECSTPKANARKCEETDGLLSTSTIISESKREKCRATVTCDNSTVTKNSFTDFMSETERNSKTTNSTPIQSRNDMNDQKKNINKTTIVPGETPTSKFLIKQKLHETVPALALGEVSTRMKQHSISGDERKKSLQRKDDENAGHSSQEFAITSGNLLNEDVDKVCDDAHSSVQEKRKRKGRTQTISSNINVDGEEKCQKVDDLVVSTESSTLDADNAREESKKKISKKKRKLVERESAPQLMEESKKKQLRRAQKRDISQQCNETENKEATESKSKKTASKVSRIGSKSSGNRLATNNSNIRKVSHIREDIALLSDSDEATASLAFSRARDEALNSIKQIAENIKVGKVTNGKRDKEQRRAKTIRQQREERILALDASKKVLKRLPEEDLEKLSDVPLRPKKKQKLSQNKQDTQRQRQKEKSPIVSRSVIASGMIESYTADQHRRDDFHRGNVSSLSSYGGTTQFSVVSLDKVKRQHKKQPSIALFRQTMLSRNARHPVSAYLMYLQKQKASSKEF